MKPDSTKRSETARVQPATRSCGGKLEVENALSNPIVVQSCGFFDAARCAGGQARVHWQARRGAPKAPSSRIVFTMEIRNEF
ncbi:MAG: hypothetical protein H0U56_10285 [Methylibium sp.]|nr:hypothetical protein [Methylibium sp.]